MKKNLFYAAAVIALTACGRFSNTSDPAKDKQVVRIVCVSKQYNEIIYALGAERNLVAVDLSSTYPDAIKSLPNVGYHRMLSAEGIISMNPTVVMHDNNVGPDNVLRQLDQLKIPIKTFGKAETIEETKGLFREMGEYFGRKVQADSLCKVLTDDMQAAVEAKEKLGGDTMIKVVVIHFGRIGNSYLIVGKHSITTNLLSMAGAQNPVEGEKGMMPLSAETIAAANPDVILVTDYGYDRLGSVDAVKTLPGVATTNAAKNNRIYRVEEHDMMYYGPRTGKNIIQLIQLIHQK
ncbi:MAG TPA: ABC transporter substrate-binding protein [Bacteroidia bacterium]|nr:ABC transporter substrate-binding protein [Bacteroidia bacterium]